MTTSYSYGQGYRLSDQTPRCRYLFDFGWLAQPSTDLAKNNALSIDDTACTGTTTFTAAIGAIPDAIDITMRTALVGFTLPFFGVFFAPIYTPHLAKLFGRRPIYLVSLPLFLLCVVVIGLSTGISTLPAFRFLAGGGEGGFGGPCVALIEGTFADV
jgi:MFS family permease